MKFLNWLKKDLYKKITVLMFAAVIFATPIITFITMPKEQNAYSENENKYLATFPVLSVTKVTDRSSNNFMNSFSTWFSDRFAGREDWIVVKNNLEKALGKVEIGGVFTYDDRMMQVWNEYDETTVANTLNAINKFTERHSTVPVYFMLAPTSQEIYSELLPSSAIIGNQKNFIKSCTEKLTNITPIDIYTTLLNNKSDYIYYRTDHHWTSLGAYYAYSTAANKLGYAAYDLSSFNIEHASSDFRGTLYSKTLDRSVTPDVMDYYTLTDNEPNLTLAISSGTSVSTYATLYMREFLSVKDKYSSFLGSNSPIMNINTDVDNDKSLLIFKDSYAHSLIPFLTKHYSKITVVDMRYINVDYRQFFTVEDYDQVLFMYNVITFSEDKGLLKLNYAK